MRKQLVLLALIFFTALNANAVELEKVTLEKSGVVAGGELTVLIKTKTGSALETQYHPMVEMWRTSGHNAYPRSAVAPEELKSLGDGWYSFTVKLSPYQQSGQYCISELRTREMLLASSDSNVCGSAPTTVYKGTQVPIVHFSLTNSQPDDEKEPVLTGLRLSKNAVVPGEMLELHYDLTDDQSGIDTDQAVLATFRSFGGQGYLYLQGRLKQVSSGEYFIRDIVPSGGAIAPGKYYAVFLEVFDRAGNFLQYETKENPVSDDNPIWMQSATSGDKVQAPVVKILQEHL
jgi:hypothetical protein